ncbi:MAG: PAS domain-containing protein, partial [Candidatus Rokuibacteriota bacterium]
MSLLQENLLFDALARAGDGALVADAEGRVVLWNQAAERLLGWSAAEALGHTCCELLDGRPADDRGACDAACPVARAGTRAAAVENFDVRARAKSGRAVSLNVSTLSLAPDEVGPLTIHLFHEVGERSTPVAGSVAAGEAASGGPLTRRELEVLRLLATGANTRVAAERLGVSPATIRNH